MSPRVLVLALVWTVVLTAVLFSPAPAQARTAESTYQNAVFVATNHARVERDRVRLRPHSCVQRYAVRQAHRMADKAQMYHQDLQPILKTCGLRAVGENVGMGYATGTDVVVLGWMRSPDHRANILRSSFRLLGVGARRSEDGTWYVAQVFGRAA